MRPQQKVTYPKPVTSLKGFMKKRPLSGYTRTQQMTEYRIETQHSMMQTLEPDSLGSSRLPRLLAVLPWSFPHLTVASLS